MAENDAGIELSPKNSLIPQGETHKIMSPKNEERKIEYIFASYH